jgi:cytochrome c2
MNTKKFLLLLLIVFSVHQIMIAAPPGDEGKTIFTARCAACHNVNKQVTGPALAGVAERRSIDWIINFVHSSQTMVGKGDATALEVYTKFNKIPMPDHKDLSEADIKNIVQYIKAETKTGMEKAAVVKPGKNHSAYLPMTIKGDYYFLLSYIAAVMILVGVLYFAVSVGTYKEKVNENMNIHF